MKIFTKIFTAIVIVLAFCNNATSQSISNKGKDFWVGYGYHQFMANGDGGNNSQDMTIYLGVEDLPAGKTYATVTVEIDSSGGATNASQWWRRVYHIPANTAISVATYNAFSFSTAATGITGAMPKTGIYNCALFDGSANCPNPERVQGFGLFRGRGIHIMSDVDITAYAHIYATTNSGATMLLPTPSWGYSYTTINSKQATAQLANNFFYIVAQEDSTVVKITPSNFPQPYACVNGSVAPLTPYTITLHKGWIYQYLGKLDATTTHLDGVDLTGSKIQSIPNAEGKCKKIAVFAGSGRTVGESAGGACAEGGRDNDMQQCFPQHTWGDDYLTSPFATSNGSSSLNACAGTNCTYKIVAQDTGTIVTVSGTTNDGSFPVPPLGFLYRASNQPCRFTSNKPIAVGQFMSSDNCSGDGDPEMIYQSPIAQAITGVSFYRQDETNIFSNFVTIILPDSGLNKLKIYDGFTNKTDTVKNNLIGANSCIKPHPRYPGYKIVTKGWAAAKGMVSISSNARFNAFTYGLGGAESYGYSGGTFLNNLAADSRVRNIYDTINNLQDSGLKFNGYVYSHSPVELKTSITYTPRKIEWLFDYLKNHPELMDTNKVLLKRVCDNVMYDRQVDTQRAYVYMPPFQYLGYDTFYVKGCSGTGACTTQMHIVKVGCPMAANTQTKYVVKTAALPPPTDSGRAAIDFAPTCGNPSYTYSCVDAYGNPTVPANRSAKKGVVTVIANSGAYQYISPTAATFNGKDTFYIKICDNGGVAPTTCFIKMYVVTVGNQFTADTISIPNACKLIDTTHIISNLIGDTITIRSSVKIKDSIYGQAATEINPHSAVPKYRYYAYNNLMVKDSLTTKGKIIIDSLTGAYKYKDTFLTKTIDTFYIQLCDSSVPMNCIIQRHIVFIGDTASFTTSTPTAYTYQNRAILEKHASLDFSAVGVKGVFKYELVNRLGITTATSYNGASVSVKRDNGIYSYYANTTPGLDSFFIKVSDSTTSFIKKYIVDVVAPQTYNAALELNPTGGKLPYTYSIVNQVGLASNISALGASVTIAASNYTYKPLDGFTGKDSFYIKVCDANSPNSCLTQKHIVTVGSAFTTNTNTINLSTTLNTKLITYASINSQVNGGIGGYVYNVVNDTGAITTISKKGCAITVKANNGIVNYNPTTGLIGIDTFYIKVCDSSATKNCFTQTYIVKIDSGLVGNTSPIIQYIVSAGNIIDTASSTHEINPRLGNKPYVYDIVNANQQPSSNKSSRGGSISINDTSGLYVYTSPANYIGVDTFYIRVRDASSPANVIVQPHYVSVYPPIIGNSVPFRDSIGKDGQLYGNLQVDMPGLPKTSQTVFSPINASGNYRDSSNRKGNLYMMPLPIDTIHDAIKGDRYVYKALPTYIPPCNYVFQQKDTVHPHIDSVYIPIVIYSTPKTGIPQGCYGAGGLIGDTINLLYIVYPPLKYDLASNQYLANPPVCPSDSTVYFTGRDSSKPMILNQKVFSQPVISHSWNIKGTFRGNVVNVTFNTRDCSVQLDRNSVYTFTYTAIFYNGAIYSYTGIDTFNQFKLDMRISPDNKKVCLGQPIKVKDTTISKETLYNYSWNFGDNTPTVISQGKDTVHIYTDTGYFYIAHTVSVKGCADTIAKVYDTVYVAAQRFPTFIHPTSCIDTSGKANLWYDSSAGGVPIKFYTWHFGEPSSGVFDSSNINPTSHIYAVEDSFHVQLHVVDTSGCKGDTTMTVPIHITPRLYFNPIAPNAMCINDTTKVSFSSLADCLNKAKVKGSGIFKGPGTDTAGNFNPKVAGAGTHQIWYIYTSKGGCVDSVSQFITVNDTAAIDFDYSPKGTCLPKDGIVKFTNLAVGGFAFTWTFDDATNATANNPNVVDSLSPSHKFCNSAMHNVKLMIETSMGCKDSIIKPLQFTVMPDIKSDTITSICEGKDSILVKFASIKNCVTSGFGTYSGIGVDPSSGYLHPAAFGYGKDTIKYVYNNNGCVDSAIQTVLIKARPRIHISYPIGCLPASGIVQFTDTSNVPDGQTIASCFWDFGHSSVGNPKTSTSCSPQHTYPYGPVVIYHSVNSSLGCFADTTINDTFRVSPSLYYNAIPAVCENLTTHSVAYAGSNNLAAVPGYGYYSGFGVIDTANGTINPSLMGAGTFAIKYTFKATSNCTLDTVQNVTIKARPKGQFTFTPNTGCLPATGTVNFDATAITVQGSTITSYNWLFENGSSSGTGVTPSHNYSDGTYAISLNVKAANGCEQDTAMTQTFNKSPLLSPLVINDTCENITAFSLVAIGKEPSVLNGVTGTGSWSDSKGAITNTANGTIDPTIAGYGIDTITYTFTTASCKSFVKGTINFKAHPRGTFTYTPQGVCLDTAGTVNFDASSIIVPNSSVASYTWDFGNTKTGTGVMPSSNYNEGTYTITLTTQGANGCSSDTSLTTTFTKMPHLDTITLAYICSNGGTTNVIPPAVLNGVTGTGTFSSTKGAVTSTGVYDPAIAGYGVDTITYTFTSTGGCVATTKFAATVKSRPTGTFTYTPLGVCLDTAGTVTFNASSFTAPLANITTYTWDFGNIKTGTGVTPSTNYFNDGTYLIKLRVDADNGCWFDTAMSATFNKTPHLAAMPSISLCENGGVDTIKPAVVLNGALGTGVFSSYKNAITNATLGIYDPSISACGVDTVYYTYTSPGLGCSATEKMIVNVLCRPTGTFVYAPNNSCLNTAGTVNFTGNIVVPNSSVLSCIYDFGDLTTGSGLNATHNYNDGTYTIKLTTQGANGCSFDTSLTATFSKTPLLANLQQGDTCENIGIITLRAPQVLNGVAGTGVFTSYKNAVTNAATGTYDPSIAGYGVDTIYYTYTSASAASCSVTQKLAFRVLARPTGTFVYAPNNNCLNAAGTVNFTGNITVPNSSVQSAIYTFGDGDSLSGLNVAHNYNEGTFTIKLDIAGANGCKFDTSLTATFSKQPSLGAFTHVPICENKGLDTFTAAIVTNNVVLRDSAFHSTKGAFVDSVRGIYDPSIAGYGTDTITYTATSKGGCSTTKTLYLQVKARPRGTFVFTPPTGCLDASGLVKFNAINIKVPNSYVQTYNWQFEAPSSPILSAGVNPTHNYADGVYDIKLNVIGANACSFDTMINQAFNRTPSLDPIQSPNVCASGAPFLLSAPAVNNGVAGTGVFTSYKNAVSGNVATGFYYNPAVGNYIVDTLYYTYTANSSCSTTVKKAIHINPVPKVKIKSPNNVCIDSMATITDASTLLSGNIVYRTWEIVGDSTFTFTNINTPVIWQFDSAKTYTVKLTVTSDSLCSASDSVSITVRPKPVASFNVSNTVCMPNGTVFFTNTSTISANNGTLNYLWNFGDPSAIGNNGNTAHTPNAQHIYSTIQNYPVSLRVTSQPFGCVSIFNDTLKPQDPFFAKPVAKFEISKDTLCENETTTFIDTLSTAPGSKLFSWTWDYGNGTTPSTTTSFYSVYAYPKAGNFIATLKVRNTELCESAPYSLPVKVYPTPTITKMPKIYALDGTMVQFTPIVKDSSNASYLWTAPQPYGVSGLNNAYIKNPYLTTTQVQPANSNNASQYYTLYAYGATGCNDTATQEVVVLGKLHIPNAFSPNGDGRNDKWVLTSLGDYPNATVDIFDRYGNKIMHLNAGQMEWDGTMNGTPAPVATYYYIIQPGYGLPQVSGWVVLLR